MSWCCVGAGPKLKADRPPPRGLAGLGPSRRRRARGWTRRDPKKPRWGRVQGRPGGGWARGRAQRGDHKMDTPGTQPPFPGMACGRRRPASKPKEKFPAFRRAHDCCTEEEKIVASGASAVVVQTDRTHLESTFSSPKPPTTAAGAPSFLSEHPLLLPPANSRSSSSSFPSTSR